MKTTLITVGSLLLVTGIGIMLYNKSKQVPIVIGPVQDAANPKGQNTTIDKINEGIDTGKQVLDALNNFMLEAFPIKLGMKGPNTKLMQQALRDKFNQLNVAVNGIYDLKTLSALKAINYATLLNNGISQADFNSLLMGVKK